MSFVSLPPHPKFGARARIPTISAPADLSTELVVTAHTVAEVLSAWVGIPEREIDERVAELYGLTNAGITSAEREVSCSE